MSGENCFFDQNSTTTPRSNVEQNDCVISDTLLILNETTRHVFLGIFVVISTMSLVGNCAAIYSISKRKCRFVQKTCIVSLAASDILSTVVIAANNLETFSHELLVWTMGSFLCSLIPMCQMAGFIASSLALMFIAMDRYRNVVHALGKRWNFSSKSCVIFAVTLWTLALAVSYPMYCFFTQQKVTLIFITSMSYTLQDAYICVSLDKYNMRDYYITMVVIFFLPLLVVFVWFYYNIASLVWRHRKPVTGPKVEVSECSTSNSQGQTRHVQRDLRVERKIRTFKMIVTLTVVFVACRLPYFTIYILKLSLVSEDYGLWTWYLNYSFVALHIVNCCLNPLLYTFLNQTLTVWVRVKHAIRDFFWEVCCFCFSSSEFEEFEKQNPSVVDYNYKPTRNSKY